MKRVNNTVLQLTVIVAIAAVVCVLGVLQYHWTGQISAAEQDRLSRVLTKSVRNFDEQFAYDFERLTESFEVDPTDPTSTLEARVIRKYRDWNQTSSRPDFLAGLYIWRKEGDRSSYLELLDQTTVQFQKSGSFNEIPTLEPKLERELGKLPLFMAGHQAVYHHWKFYGDSLALVRPVFRVVSPARESDMAVEPVGFLVVRLDGAFLKDHYFPGLIERYFADSGFNVAIRSAAIPHRAVYLGDPSFPISTSSPDAERNLFESVDEQARRRGHPLVDFEGEGGEWQLVAQHPSGSLEGAVVDWRRRNLAISLALLALLLCCAGLIVSVARRSERLSNLQMQFVAGVSHELCTPLTVINSTIENLADGIVDDPAQIQEYAAILRGQGDRLSRLLDQVLLLASGKLGETPSKLRPVDLAAVVLQTIATSEKTLRDEGFTLQKEIAMNLPPVKADPVLLGECVANLIGNAVKYAGGNRWIAVRIQEVKARALHEVQLTVEDRGIGIAAGDLRSIFEPFYRVQAVRDGQARGVGLGLYLVKRMVENMGGQISVSSEIGRGSSFILHFSVRGALKDGLAGRFSSPSAVR